MWIVRVALNRPYTFIVLALLILILSPVIIQRTPTDVFPNIDIPVIAAAFNYSGLNAEEMEERITSSYERILTTTVSDIEHIESQSTDGRAIIKVFFQPNANISAATAQVTAVSQSVLRQLPPGVTAPFLVAYNASSVPILQLGLSGRRAFRAAALRLRHELHSHAAGDRAGLRHPVSLRRQAAPDCGGSQPRRDAIPRPLAGGRGKCRERAEPDHSGGDLEDRAVRIRRGFERQPEERWRSSTIFRSRW